MDFLINFIRETIAVFVHAAPFLLFGFFIAGLLKVLIPPEWFARALGRRDFRSVLLASLAGVPLPLCSCSVLPTAMALRHGGASKGATTSFLISTPETGVDSISITYALLDPIMTVARPLSAFATAMVAGTAVNIGESRDEKRAGKTDRARIDGTRIDLERISGARIDRERIDRADPPAPIGAMAPQQALNINVDALSTRIGVGTASPTLATEATGTSHGCGCAADSVTAGACHEPRHGRVRQIFDYAYGDLLDSIAPWFVLGILITGFISAVIPDGALNTPVLRGLPSMLIMLAIGIPLYVCATASTPIAAALVMKGLNPGAALVFMLSGPATNAASLTVLVKMLGGRTVAIYLASIAIMSLAAGAIVNAIYSASGINAAALAGEASSELPRGVEIAAAFVLLALIVRSAVRINMLGAWWADLRRLARRVGRVLGRGGK